MEKIYKKPESLNGNPFGYCPGCMHSTISKLVAQVIDEMGLREKAVCVLPVGCGTLGCFTWNLDMVCSAHGRAPAVATGVKRCKPGSFVFTYQGDGDLGGQMAPTTLVGMKATTCPNGRDPETEGYPMHMAEMIAQLKRPAFCGRFAVDTPAIILQTKKAIRKAFQNQLDGKGFSLVEILSNCPTNWGLSPLKTLDFIHQQTMGEFPLGVFKDI